MTELTIKCRLCEQPSTFQFSKTILGKYDVSYFECTHCKSLQTEEPYWLGEAYGEDAEKYDTAKASRTLENFFNLPSLFDCLNINKTKPCVEWGGCGGLLTRLLRDIGYNFFCYDLHLKSEFAQGFQWQKKNGKVYVVTAFEVAQFFTNPIIEWQKVFSLSPEWVICSTTIYEKQGVSWPYLSAQNGQHIFFYSEFAIATIAARFGYTVYNIGSYLLFCKSPLKFKALEDLGSWPHRIKELQIKSFAHWRSEAFRFAAEDHKLLTTPMTVSQGRGFVVIDMIFFQLNNSGIARVWESLIREWSKTDLGSKLIILDRAKSSPRIDGVRYIDIPGYNYEQNDADAQMLEKICQENQASVFLSTYYTKPLFTPTLLMIHDMIPERLGFDLNHPAWRLKHAAIQAADKIVCVSQNTATDLANYFALEFDKISVAHCGVDLKFKPATTNEINSIRAKYGITKPYFLFVGERAGYKNAALLFTSFRGLPNSDKYQIVCLGGSREMETEYLPLIEGLDILMFRVDNSEMHSIYSGALALVYPSIYEGFGLPVIEAMACGCPVITCRGGSIPEISGDDVLYTEPTNVVATSAAMVSVMNNELREKLIKGGLSRASLFSWERMANKVETLIKELIHVSA